MGVRLNAQSIEHPEIAFYGTGLFGYLDDKEQTKTLKSYKYLKQIDKLHIDADDDEDLFADFPEYCWGHIELTEDQFKQFIEYYESDIREIAKQKWPYHPVEFTFKDYDDARKKEYLELKDTRLMTTLLNTPGNKIIWWD